MANQNDNKHRRMSATVKVLAAVLVFSVGSAALALTEGIVGDRLVLAVNETSYSQRQIESYITIKESLRRTSDGTVRSVDARNWGDAIQVFTQDMIIFHEVQRLGSYQAQEQALGKYAELVKSKAGSGSALAATLTRLGVSDQEIMLTLATVLRIAAYQKSKDKQESRTSPEPDQGDQAGLAGSRWFQDLRDRAVVRLYKDATRYVMIRPIQQGAGNGSP